MKTLDLNIPENKKKRAFQVNFSNTKRIKWDRFRRYGFYAS
tara:strand:+ start:228 stop:350 length:123 start_codon:yes stop_codon:yes gene_type:complete